MKKRRFSAKVLTSLFTLALAVSAFFYAPMDVRAETYSASGSGTASGNTSYNVAYVSAECSGIDLSSYVSSELSETSPYRFTVNGIWDMTTNRAVYWRSLFYSLNGLDTEYVLYFAERGETGTHTSEAGTFSTSFIAYPGEVESLTMFGSMVGYSSSTSNLTCNFGLTIRSVSVVDVSPSDSEAYSNGYEAGYQNGLTVGNSQGYSSGYDAGYTDGESEGYGKGFSDGQGDGYQSGYKAGYNAASSEAYDLGLEAGYTQGYAEAYSIALAEGYASGYESAMARIESWGADGTEYPVELFSYSLDSYSFDLSTYSSLLDTNTDVLSFLTDCEYIEGNFDVDPNHVYRFDVSLGNSSVASSDGATYSYEFCVDVGSGSYLVPRSKSGSFYVDGSNMSNYFEFRCNAYGLIDVYIYHVNITNFTLVVYDMGPTGNIQNHIANQTDKLTNGYDSSAGEESASQFADGVADYNTTENSLFTSAKSGLQDYDFFDFTSVPAVVTGLSFVTAIMTTIFNSMGGASGAGIVLSVLFSVMLVSIVAGLYRYFVSNGKSGKHDKKGGS